MSPSTLNRSALSRYAAGLFQVTLTTAVKRPRPPLRRQRAK